MWRKPSWRRSPLAPLYSQWEDNPQTAEQLYQRNSCIVKKVLGPTMDFSTWGSGKGTENLQGILLWRSMGFDYRISKVGENRLLEEQTKRCVHQDPGESSSDPTRGWTRLACECPGVSGRSMGSQWPAAGSGALNKTVLGAMACWHKSFWSRSPLLSLPLP